jgi:hypothetical protein
MARSTPEIISSNLVLPYLVAVWEEYFRTTFTAALQFSSQREAALKRVRLTSDHLERVLTGHIPVERALAETFGFQRPSAIVEHFKLLDRKLDLGAAFRHPYRRRRQSLFDSIEAVVERRNAIVHTGDLAVDLDSNKLKGIVADFEVAADRAYEHIGHYFGFTPIQAYPKPRRRSPP